LQNRPKIILSGDFYFPVPVEFGNKLKKAELWGKFSIVLIKNKVASLSGIIHDYLKSQRILSFYLRLQLGYSFIGLTIH